MKIANKRFFKDLLLVTTTRLTIFKNGDVPVDQRSNRLNLLKIHQKVPTD